MQEHLRSERLKPEIHHFEWKTLLGHKKDFIFKEVQKITKYKPILNQNKGGGGNFNIKETSSLLNALIKVVKNL